MSNWHLEFSSCSDWIYCSAVKNSYSMHSPSVVRSVRMWRSPSSRWRNSERLRHLVTSMVFQDDARGIMDWSGKGLQLRARCAAAILNIRVDEP